MNATPESTGNHSPIAAAIGNTVEWFDFAVYGYFAESIGAAFFPQDSASLQFLSAFGVFAAGYLMRPIGGLVLGPIGDMFGRRILLLMSVAIMGSCSLLIALLPTTDQIGPTAAVLLVLLRMIQGLSVGAEYSSSIAWSVETSPQKTRGFLASVTAAGATVGFISGSLVATVIDHFIPITAMNAGGWRIPFVIGSLLALLALMLRRSIQDSRPEGASSSITGQWHQVMTDWPAMLRLMGTVGVATAVFYAVGVYYVDEASRLDPANASLYNGINTVVQLFGLGMALLAGRCADRFSPLPLVRRSLLISMVLMVPGLLILAKGGPVSFAMGQAMVLLPIFFYSGVTPLLHPLFFPGGSRCASFSFSYSLVVAVVGGTAPIVSTWLRDLKGWPNGLILYLLILAVPAFWAWSSGPRHLRFQGQD